MKRLLMILLFVSVLGGAVLAEGARDRAQIIVPESTQTIYDSWHFAPAVKIDGKVYLSGVVAAPIGGDLQAGYHRAWTHIREVLHEAGATLDDIVDITTYHTDLKNQLPDFSVVKDEYIRPPYGAWTAVGVTELATPNGVTEIKVIAHVAEAVPVRK